MDKISLRKNTNIELIHAKWFVYLASIGIAIFAWRVQQLVAGNATVATPITWFSGFMVGILLSPSLRIWQRLSKEDRQTRDEYLHARTRKSAYGLFRLLFGRIVVKNVDGEE